MKEDIQNYSPTVMFRGTPCYIFLYIIRTRPLITIPIIMLIITIIIFPYRSVSVSNHKNNLITENRFQGRIQGGARGQCPYLRLQSYLTFLI